MPLLMHRPANPFRRDCKYFSVALSANCFHHTASSAIDTALPSADSRDSCESVAHELGSRPQLAVLGGIRPHSLTSPMKLTATELTMRSSVDSDMTRKRQPAIHTASSSSISVMGTSAISQRRRRLEGRTWPGLGLGSGLG